MAGRFRLIDLGNAQYVRFAKLAGFLEADGDIVDLVRDFLIPIDAVRARLATTDLAETLLLIRLDSVAYSAVHDRLRSRLDSAANTMLLSGGIETRTAEFAQQQLTELMSADPRMVDRLELLARRFTGELVALVQRLAAEKPELVAFVTDEQVGLPSLSAMGELISYLTHVVNDESARLFESSRALSSS